MKSIVGVRARRAACAGLMLAAATAAGAPQAAAALPGAASAKASQGAAKGAGPELRNCGPIQRRVARLTGARKRQARRALVACRRQNAANRTAFNQIRDHRLAGTRGDGAIVDHVFCANGNYTTSNTSRTGTGISQGTSWRTSDSVVRRGGRWITTIVRDRSRGLEIAVARRGAQWKIGIVAFGKATQLGDVTRSGARTDCAEM